MLIADIQKGLRVRVVPVAQLGVHESKAASDLRVLGGAGIDTGLWGVWDRRHGSWIARPEHEEDLAEQMAAWVNEAYAAGFADAAIVKAHGRARLRGLL